MSVRTINKESFIYNRETSEIHTLNKTGSLILSLMIENCNIKEIPQKVHEKFEIDIKCAEKDTNLFIEELLTKKVLLKSESQ